MNALKRAVKLFEAFHGEAPEQVDTLELTVPAVAMMVGRVAAIEYDTPCDPENRYRHEFSEESQPMLAVTHDGRQLLLLGGKYYFNDHGIIDGVPPKG